MSYTKLSSFLLLKFGLADHKQYSMLKFSISPYHPFERVVNIIMMTEDFQDFTLTLNDMRSIKLCSIVV